MEYGSTPYVGIRPHITRIKSYVQFSQEATALYTVPFKYQQLWYKCLL